MGRKKYRQKKRAFVKRMLAVILSFCMMFGMASFVGPVEVQAMTTQSDAVQWARNQVGSQYNEGFGVQCVALIKKYCDYLGVSRIYGNANQYVSNAIPTGWSRIAGAAVQPGDIAIWTGGAYAEYGHVAIVLSSNGSSFEVIDQNGDGNQARGTIRTKSYGGGYWGVIRPNFNNDTTPPTISDFHVGELRTEGFTVMAKVTDANGISAVRYAIWTEKDGWDDLRWYDGNCTDGNDYYWVRINFSDYKNRKGKYIIHMYAYDLAGNETGSGIEYDFNSEGPLYTDFHVGELRTEGFTVMAKVTDANGISAVRYAVWPEDGWDSLRWYDGNCTDGNDYYWARINFSDYNNKKGKYIIHMHAYDSAGKAISTGIDYTFLEEGSFTPVNTVSYNGHTYHLYNDILTWDGAKAKCEELGGHLVTITSAEEQETVAGLVRGQACRGYWIGGSSHNGSTWVNGEAFSYSNWEPGEPNADGGEDSYGIYTGSGTWNDWLGSDNFWGLGFICEWDGKEAEKPDNSDNPDNPNTPNNSDDSDTPDNSDKPDKPDAPENPDNSDQTDSPNAPETQDKPGNSNDTDNSEKSDNSKKPTVSKVKSFKATAGKKKLMLSWKKLSGAAGYQIQISTKKNFKGAKTISISKSKKTYTKKSLKAKKKYYIRIRAYKTYKDVNKKTKKVYGKWTTINKKTK